MARKLPPDALNHDYQLWVAQDCLPELDPAVQAVLAPPLAAIAANAAAGIQGWQASLTAFLNAQGSPIWELFNSKLQDPQRRSFVPIDAGQRQAFIQALTNAFAAPIPLPPPGPRPRNILARLRAWAALHLWRTGDRRAQTVRFAVSVTLLVLGFGIIWYTNSNISNLVVEYQTKRRAAFEQSDPIKTAAAQFKDLGTTISDLGRYTAELHPKMTAFKGNLDKLSTIVSDLQQSIAATKPMADQVGKQSEAIAQSAVDLGAATKPLLEPPPGPAPPAGQPAPLSVVDAVKAAAAAVSNAPATPGDLKTDADQLAADSKTILPAKLRTILSKNTIDKGGGSWWLLLGGDTDKTAFVDALRPAGDGTTSKPDSFSRLEAEATAFQSKIASLKTVPIEPVSARAIQVLSDRLGSVRVATDALNTTGASLKKEVEALNKSAKNISEMNVTATLMQIDTILSSVRDPIKSLIDASGAYEKSATIMKNLENASEGAKRISDLQDSLAVSRTAPAIWLMLAIGGMFVTFGLSSLLRWIKVMDQDRAYAIWDQRVRHNAALAAPLLAYGIDPSDVLRRLQNTPMPEDIGKNRPVETPLSATLPELVNMFRSSK